MASGSNEQPIGLSNKILLLDGDIRKEIVDSVRRDIHPAQLHKYNSDKQWLILSAHKAFLLSGTNLIRTNTYYSLYPYLKTYLTLTEETYAEEIGKAVYIARLSTGNSWFGYDQTIRPLVVGSCGCFGDETINYLSPNELKNAHRQRISKLLQGDVDILSLEGIRNIEEANMLFDLMREFPNAKFLVMFDGELCHSYFYKILDTIRHFYYVYGSQITAIGLNNSSDRKAKEFCDEINYRRTTNNLIPLVMCTNKSDGIAWNPFSHTSVAEWQNSGLRFIGGGNNVVSRDMFLKPFLINNYY